MLPFCGHFYRISHQQSNSNKFKDFETFYYYVIRIETFELTTVEKTRLQNQNLNYMMKKKVQGTQKFVRFRWFFELCEFELKEFSCKGLLVNFKGTEESVRIRWSFELKEFELHDFNCIHTCQISRNSRESHAFKISRSHAATLKSHGNV